jgi:HEAT repeat protein
MTTLTLFLVLAATSHLPSAIGHQPAGPDLAIVRAEDPEQNTPADSLYRAGQAALNRGEYQKAVDTYRQLRRQYPRHARVGDALYWEAFALYRLGGSTNLRVARERLKSQETDFPRASTRTDAGSLRVRIERDLARVGDAEARAWLDAQGSTLASTSASETASASASASARAGRDAARAERAERAERPERPERPERAERPERPDRDGDIPAGCDREKYEEQMMAVQALMTMDHERSVPILKRVMARRDECSAPLRRQAVFVLGQASEDSDVAPLMLEVVRTDPDREVKKMALFALGQTNDPAAVPALAEVLRTSDDRELQQGALFALSQTDDDRGAGILREYITRTDVSDELMGQAVLWLGQKGGAEAAFLRQTYPRLRSHQARQMVMMTLAQTGDAENARWLMERVLDRSEDIETRKSALFFVGTESDAVSVQQIAALYSPTLDVEMRKQILFVLSQRREPAAVDKLLDIAKNDPDRELRKQAVFWLGQSGDPRAAELLERMLDQ